MFLDKIFPHAKKERKVIENMREHIKLLCMACETFRDAMEAQDLNLMRKVIDLERVGDTIRREIISKIYEGAFLPYLRSNLCAFVEIVDRVFDIIEDAAFQYLDARIPEAIVDECNRVAFLNVRICEMLYITFEAMIQGEDLREKTLAIRIYEKKIDDLKFILLKDARKLPVKNFWEGRILSEFLTALTTISDIIEDASDHLQIINVSMR